MPVCLQQIYALERCLLFLGFEWDLTNYLMSELASLNICGNLVHKLRPASLLSLLLLYIDLFDNTFFVYQLLGFFHLLCNLLLACLGLGNEVRYVDIDVLSLV